MSIGSVINCQNIRNALKNPALSGSSSHFPGNIVTQCRYSISTTVLAIARDFCSCPSCRCSWSAHSRFWIHGKQHKRVAGSHMQLINESATAMSPPIPMLGVVSLQQRRSEFKDPEPRLLLWARLRCAWLPTAGAFSRCHCYTLTSSCECGRSKVKRDVAPCKLPQRSNAPWDTPEALQFTTVRSSVAQKRAI